VAWTTRGLDELYDRWVADDEPDIDTRVKVIHWLMDFKTSVAETPTTSSPAPRDSAPVPGTPTPLWVADIPNTNVTLLYSVHEQHHQIVGWLLESLDP
jgi:hypothetical protein